MGDIADMILDGILCSRCGGLVDGEETGYPRECSDCKPSKKKKKKKPTHGGNKR